MANAVIPIYLEIGRKRVFASAVEWPGWSRAAKSPEQAVESLAQYESRYREVAELAGLVLPADAEFTVVEEVTGTSTTDFGAPDRPTTADAEPVTTERAAVLAAVVTASWRFLDAVVTSAPAELQTGPRGGGRDRDAVFEHVIAAEAAYARKAGVVQKTPKPGDDAALNALRSGVLGSLSGDPAGAARWSPPYAARRIAWHVLDHAWEIQDRSIAGDTLAR
jgi:hypothetical protein